MTVKKDTHLPHVAVKSFPSKTPSLITRVLGLLQKILICYGGAGA